MPIPKRLLCRALTWLFAVLTIMPVRAADDDDAATRTIAVANGRYTLTAPDDWKREEPRSRIIEHEFSVPADEEGELPGRMTIMAAGGSIEANIERWYAQFKQPTGGATADAAKQEKKAIGDVEVHLVDISGTFVDRPNPMATGVDREDYRMLAAILTGDKIGQYFIKFYGPAKLVEARQQAFVEMIDGLQAK